MSGHSKWSNIKHRKAIEDAKRGKLFTKLGRLIAVAARQGGGDPEANAALRVAIEKAKQGRMPKDRIEAAIKRGIGGKTGEGELSEVIYEGYGPVGVAFLVKCLTDNKNRSTAEVRQAFSKHGGSLGEAGSTAYIFGNDPDNPQFSIPVVDSVSARKVLILAEALDDLDDVQEVYANFDIPDELLAELKLN